ncbi:hypothetical protein Tco_0851993, partial [Tanacetum coccineum]
MAPHHPCRLLCQQDSRLDPPQDPPRHPPPDPPQRSDSGMYPGNSVVGEAATGNGFLLKIFLVILLRILLKIRLRNVS